MKTRRPRITIKPLKVEVSNEEIMRDLLFPVPPRSPERRAGAARR